jgi:hypothetical protein
VVGGVSLKLQAKDLPPASEALGMYAPPATQAYEDDAETHRTYVERTERRVKGWLLSLIGFFALLVILGIAGGRDYELAGESHVSRYGGER